jgi:L-lactate dehydrogenase
LADAELVMIAAGINEKTGGAVDRSDRRGRLRLLDTNAEIYSDIVPRVVRAASRAVILVITDPPDPLVDVVRTSAGHDRVLGTGTFLDSLRFRVLLAEHFDVDATQVEAQVIGEHGVSQVFLWSTACIAGVPISTLIKERGDASRLGIGIVAARIVEMVLRDERAVTPIGSYNDRLASLCHFRASSDAGA